jgi:hypothetical protein
MTQEQISNKIRDIYNSEKGKGFITHLLRSFFPINKAQYLMFDLEDDKGNPAPMKCCITGEQVYSKGSKLNIVLQNHEHTFKNFIDRTIKAVNEERQIDPVAEAVTNEVKEKLNSMPLAVTSEQSDKLISDEAFQALQNFYFSEMLRGNKHVNWIANNEKAKWISDSAKRDGIISTKKEEKVIHKAVEHSKMSLGDLDVLKDLKKKFESNS